MASQLSDEAHPPAPDASPVDTLRQRTGTMGKKWKDQVKKDKTIYKNLAEFVQKRKSKYVDLDDLLVKKERICSLSQAVKKEPVETPDSPKQYARRAFMKHEERDQAVDVALETASRVHGSQEGITKKEILDFVQKKFDVTGKRLEMAEERTSQQPKLQLMCKVMKATNLKGKSGNGSPNRNPYCRVGIMSQKHYHPGSDFKFMAEWCKVGEIGDFQSTSFKTATLEPVWNEDIQLSVGNVEEDVVVIEVWDHPPLDGAAKKKKKRNVKGLGSHSKEDFIGWMFHPLLLIPIAGAEFKVTLMSRSKKPQNGFITVFLSIQGDTEGKPVQARLDDHHLLTRAFVDDFSRDDDGEHKLEWSGELCTQSEKLLEYHGSLNALSNLQMASVRLSELLKYHKYEAVNLKAFIDVVKRMKELQFLLPEQGVANGSVHDASSSDSSRSSSPQDTSEMLDRGWVNQLFTDLHVLEADLMDTMKDHIRLVNFGLEGKPETIYPHLSLLLELYTFEAFTDQMNPKKVLRRELEKCIEPSVDSWFSMLKKTVMPTKGSEPRELRDLCVYCLTWSERVVENLILHETFTRADVDYFSFYILSLDEQLCEEVKKGLEMYSRQKPDTITFEIYTHFQRLVEISENADEDIRSKLNILGFHKWFQEFIPGWIDVATEKCESRVRQAIELDEIVKITDELKMSASAVDTNAFLLQMATFWQHLDWPVASESLGYAGSLIENLCTSVNLYIEEVYGSLKLTDMQDEHGRFKVSEKLCLVLNNMFHVREQLSDMPKHMELEKLYKMLLEEDAKKYSLAEEGGPDVGNMDFDPMMTLNIKAKNVLNALLINADEDIMNKINELVKKICQNILPDIKRFIGEMVNTNANDDDELIVASLCDYLMENLITLGNNLFPSVFQSITATLWEVSVAAIAEVVGDSHKRNLPIYLRLYNALNALRDFYYCEGAGVTGKALDSEAYVSLKSKLDILGMPTNQLIVRFYAEFMTHQQEQIKQGKFGELTLSVGFMKESSVIEVNVIQGDNMEMVGEPYIKLRLSSVCQASDKHWKTKPIKGMQKSPLFNEEIKLSVTEEEMNSEGSVVFFYLLDRKLKSRFPVGMCAVACKKIPQLSASSKSSIMEPLGPERKNFRLPLFRFTEETPCLKELATRADKKDVVASNFLKLNELLFSHLPHLNPNQQKIKFATARKGRANTTAT